VNEPRQPDNSKEKDTLTETAAGDDVARPEIGDKNAYRVVLPTFEGPLDLLLHLIQKHELDILDIPIGFVAQKYGEYLRMMQELSIDIASEYLVMAATLAYIKSRSLLPPDPTQADEEIADEEEEDPRLELIRRLLEYQKYKHAAEELGSRSVLGRDVFPRGIAIDASVEPAPLAPLSLFRLVDAFQDVLKRAKRVEEHQIDFERISISDRIGTINELLAKQGSLRFEELFVDDRTRAEMIVTFLALLEMTKLRMVHLRQDDSLGPIVVELRVREDDDDEHSWTAERAPGAEEPRPKFVSEFDLESERAQSAREEWDDNPEDEGEPLERTDATRDLDAGEQDAFEEELPEEEPPEEELPEEEPPEEHLGGEDISEALGESLGNEIAEPLRESVATAVASDSEEPLDEAAQDHADSSSKETSNPPDALDAPQVNEVSTPEATPHESQEPAPAGADPTADATSEAESSEAEQEPEVRVTLRSPSRPEQDAADLGVASEKQPNLDVEDADDSVG
jgi:segregation and condensation protein A